MTISGPSPMHMCSCGHRATQHPSTGERPCVARECHCKTYDMVPLPRCATCSHFSVCHYPRTPQNLWACTATGCRCGNWRERQLSESNDGNHGNDGLCLVVTETDHGNVTISIPTEANRQVLIRETATGLFEIILSRPSRSRRASIRDAADRSG